MCSTSCALSLGICIGLLDLPGKEHLIITENCMGGLFSEITDALSGLDRFGGQRLGCGTNKPN